MRGPLFGLTWIRCSVNLFLLFPNYPPIGKGLALPLNTFVSPSQGNTLCQVWLKLAQWFWRRKFIKLVNFFNPSQISPLWEGRGPSFEETWIPLPKNTFAKFGWKWPSGFGEKDEIWSLQTNGRTDGRTNGRTDDERQVIRRLTWAYSSA